MPHAGGATTPMSLMLCKFLELCVANLIVSRLNAILVYYFIKIMSFEYRFVSRHPYVEKFILRSRNLGFSLKLFKLAIPIKAFMKMTSLPFIFIPAKIDSSVTTNKRLLKSLFIFSALIHTVSSLIISILKLFPSSSFA